MRKRSIITEEEIYMEDVMSQENSKTWSFGGHTARPYRVNYGYCAKCSCGWTGPHRNLQDYIDQEVYIDQKACEQAANNDASNHVLYIKFKDFKSTYECKVHKGIFLAYSVTHKKYLAQENARVRLTEQIQKASTSRNKQSIINMINTYTAENENLLFQAFEICLENVE